MKVIGGEKKLALRTFLCFLLTGIVLSVVVAPAASAINSPVEQLRKDRTLYSIFKETNILFWNPFEELQRCNDFINGTYDADINFNLTGDNQSDIINALLRAGYSETAVAAILGNLSVESGLEPAKLQGGAIVDESGFSISDGKGFGLAQWTTSGRKQGLKDYASNHGLSVTSLDAQIGFLLSELTSGRYSGATPSELNNMSLEEATFTIRRYYESPAAMIYSTHNGTYYNDYSPKTLSDVSKSSTNGAYGELKKALNAAQKIAGLPETDPGSGGDGSVNLQYSSADGSSGNYLNCLEEYMSGNLVGLNTDDISELAMELAWGDSDHKKDLNPKFAEAARALGLNPNSPSIYMDCGTFVGVVMRSTVDKNYPIRGTSSQAPYLQSSSAWTRVENTGSTSNLQPGDVFIVTANSSADNSTGRNYGHTFIYVGNGKIASASSGSSSGRIIDTVTFVDSKGRGEYQIYRHTG